MVAKRIQAPAVGFLALWAAVLLSTLVGADPAKKSATKESEAPAIDPRAVELVKEMSESLKDLKTFRVSVASTMDAVLKSGQKVQFNSASDVVVQRPNRLRSDRVGGQTDLSFFYDGKAVTLYGKNVKYYATRPAPGNIDDMLDEVRAKLNIEPPGADLLYADVYDGLMSGVTKATYVGPSVVNGVKTHHLAFRKPETDWQIWIEEGGKHLPRKYLITTTADKSAPEFGVEIAQWDLSPKIDEATFKFAPPRDAQKIDFLPAGGKAANTPAEKGRKG